MGSSGKIGWLYLQAAHVGGWRSIWVMKGGYSYHLIASFKNWSVLVTETDDVDDDDDGDEDDDDDNCPVAFCVLWKRLVASLNRSHSTKSIIASAKERAKSSVRDTVRCLMNSAENGSRIFALSVTWDIDESGRVSAGGDSIVGWCTGEIQSRGKRRETGNKIRRRRGG